MGKNTDFVIIDLQFNPVLLHILLTILEHFRHLLCIVVSLICHILLFPYIPYLVWSHLFLVSLSWVHRCLSPVIWWHLAAWSAHSGVSWSHLCDPRSLSASLWTAKNNRKMQCKKLIVDSEVTSNLFTVLSVQTPFILKILDPNNLYQFFLLVSCHVIMQFGLVIDSYTISA